MAFPEDYTAVTPASIVASADMNAIRQFIAGLPAINVKGRGALGNNSADDTAEIQDAIADVAALGGGTVELPPGRYVITAPLVLPSWVRLRGPDVPFRTSEITGGDALAGRGATIVIGGAKNFHMITNSDTTNGNTTILLEGLELDQTGATGDVDIVRMTKAWRVAFLGCYFRGAATTNRRGVSMRGASEQTRLDRNTFEGCGIHIDASNAAWITNNEVGVATHGIQIVGGAGATGYGHHLHGNHLYNSSGDQIRLTNVNGATVTQNHLEDGDAHGIAADHGLKNSAIHANIVKKNGKSAAGVYSGIILDSDTAASASENNSIIGNHVYDDHGTPTQGYGINLVSFSGSQTNTNIVEGNVLWGNTVAQLDEAAGLSNVIGEQVGWGTGTATWDPASVAAGAQVTTTVTVTGAKLGDRVDVSFSLDLSGQQLTGYVSAANTVTAVLRNGTAGPIDLASGTLRARVRRG